MDAMTEGTGESRPMRQIVRAPVSLRTLPPLISFRLSALDRHGVLNNVRKLVNRHFLWRRHHPWHYGDVAWTTSRCRHSPLHGDGEQEQPKGPQRRPIATLLGDVSFGHQFGNEPSSRAASTSQSAPYRLRSHRPKVLPNREASPAFCRVLRALRGHSLANKRV